ncbi:cation:proton antiporter [Sphingomonas sp. ID0503]|uniref:cation:proton antiporter n=1 Tax=Sphingomonas sp. ID0503 TaxID=3399691 RepID=UPI003AFA947D
MTTSSVHATELLLSSVLLQIVVMIAAARAMHSLFRAMGQPGVVGEIVAGLALGPSLLGHFLPGFSATVFGAEAQPVISVLSQIGLILLMFQIGSGFEFGRLAQPRLRKAVVLVAAASLVAPFALGFGLGWAGAAHFVPGASPLPSSLFCGVALAITAVPILGRIINEYRLTDQDTGIVAISAAAINDVAGWLLLASISALAAAQFSGGHALGQLAGLAVLIVGIRLAMPLIDRLLARWPVADGRLPPNLMAFALCLMLLLAIVTYRIGIFAIFGGFAAGLLFHRHADFARAWADQVGRFVMVFFLPVFFTFTGLRTNLLALSPAEFGWLAVVCAAAIMGKLVPVYVAGRASGFAHRDSMILGTLMNTRALMELIVLNVGYDLGILPRPMFTILVVMAVVTTVMTGPLLRLLLAPRGTKLQTVEA